MQYEVSWVAISHYYHEVCNEKVTKDDVKEHNLTLTKEQYMLVSITDFSLRRLW